MSARALRAALVVVASLAGPPASARPSAPSRTIALIVTSNHGATLGRPDLQYADDDGAKYHATFRTVAAEADVHLLTELDRDTARLFPELDGRVRRPTKRAVLAAARAIAREVASARRAGGTVDVYFVFAGHGDIEGGRGFLELADARFYSDDLEALLVTLGQARVHVILDSCNSFFVVNARRPGGKRFATPDDLARSLGARLPDVGVFLSTSAEAEVYEWSELQSGIFSHAVRSGLAGGADADVDGVVSYEELAGFVDTASAGVANPAYRPKVFARGPSGRGSAPLLRLARAEGVELRLAPADRVRLTVRDGDELAWIDVFKEAGVAMTLRLPVARLADAVVDELEVSAGATRRVRRRTLPPSAGGSVELGALALADASAAPRGPSDLFRRLFTVPFGPRALVAYRASQAAEPRPVLGISREDAERMVLLLDHVGGLERRGRLIGTSALVGLGAVGVGAGAWMLGEADDLPGAPPAALGYGFAIGGAGVMLAGTIGLFRPSPAERLREDFAAGLARGDDPAVVVARTEDELRELAADYRRTRAMMGWTGAAIGAAGLSLLVANELRGDRGDRLSLGTLAVAGGWAALSSRFEYPIERMVRLWAADPSIRQVPRLTLSPVAGGAAVGLHGSF